MVFRMPSDQMLEKGKQTNHFFEVVQDEYGRRRWSLKPIDKFVNEFKLVEQPSKKYFAATTLPDIIKEYPIGRKGIKEADAEKGSFSLASLFFPLLNGIGQLIPSSPSNRNEEPSGVHRLRSRTSSTGSGSSVVPATGAASSLRAWRTSPSTFCPSSPLEERPLLHQTPQSRLASNRAETTLRRTTSRSATGSNEDLSRCESLQSALEPAT